MYAYIFDSFLQDRKYQHDISHIESRLATLGIQGKTEKMTILKNVPEATRQAIKRGATTVVLIGNDETITKALPQIIETDVTLGFIPVGPQQQIAKILGIPHGLSACDTLSRRVVRNIDLGKAGAAYFLFNLVAPSTISVDCGQYRIATTDPLGKLSIVNFPISGVQGSPDDGTLELVVTPGEERRGWGRRPSDVSVFPIQSVKITSSGGSATLTLDGHLTVKTPLVVEVAKRKLSMIVGKDRSFS